METKINAALSGDTHALQEIWPKVGIWYLDGKINSDTFYTLSKMHRAMIMSWSN